MFWKTKEKQTVPATWKVGDFLYKVGDMLNSFRLTSISPDRTSMIVEEDHFDGLFEIEYSDKIRNFTLECKIKRDKERAKRDAIKQKLEDWSEYNKALLELQKQFGI